MATFKLKQNDTRPVLSIILRDPPAAGAEVGDVHDLTGATSATLRVVLPDGSVLTRTLSIDADPTTGAVSYTWQTTDWGAGKLARGEHRFDVKVLGPGDARLTFPNEGFDVLVVDQDPEA